MQNKKLKILLVVSLVSISFFVLRLYYIAYKEKEVLAKYDAQLMRLVGILNVQYDLAARYENAIPKEELVCVMIVTHRELSQVLSELRPELVIYESGRDFLNLAEQRMGNIENHVAPFASVDDFWNQKCM